MTDGYYRLLPEYIASSKDLSGDEKVFYALIMSLITKFGFCWASNKYLMERSNCCRSSINRYLRKLVKLNLLIVEVEDNNERKIWTPETWGNRKNLLEAYGKEIVNSKENLNQRFCGCVRSDTGGVSAVTHRIYNVIENTSKNIKNTETRWRAGASSKEETAAQLQPLMKKFTPPTPGPAKMVEEVKRIVENPICLGQKKFLLSKEDQRFFYGFSPMIINEAINKAYQMMKQGTRIKNLPALLFKFCADIKKNRN